MVIWSQCVISVVLNMFWFCKEIHSPEYIKQTHLIIQALYLDKIDKY